MNVISIFLSDNVSEPWMITLQMTDPHFTSEVIITVITCNGDFHTLVNLIHSEHPFLIGRGRIPTLD